MRTWKERYFVLREWTRNATSATSATWEDPEPSSGSASASASASDGGVLEYYSPEGMCKGRIALTCRTACRKFTEEEAPKPHTLLVQEEHGRVLVVSACDDAELAEWTRSICGVLRRHGKSQSLQAAANNS